MMKSHTKPQQSSPNILILTASIGSGHTSVASAVAEAIKKTSDGAVKVEIADLITAISNLATTATKKLYLNSLKISPKIYELIFSHSISNEWPIKLLNILSAPFMHQKFLDLLNAKKPAMLVSTYPMWDIIIKKSWQLYGRGKLPFVTILTDAINVHSSWLTGKPDFFIVPNEDTKVSLQNAGIEEKRIRVFGTPIGENFFDPIDGKSFIKKLKLDPAKKTILFIISEGMRMPRIKKIISKLHQSKSKNIQLAIIAAASDELRKKLAAMYWSFPVFISGRTNEMPSFLNSADIVMTKAGGCTVAECINCKKPMIIVDAIPGHEMGNVLLIQKYNLGVVLNNDLTNFDWAVNYILNNEKLLRKNLETQTKPHAASDIAKFLISLLQSA